MNTDGPALRSIAFITYANWLRANGNATFVTSRLWPIIKLDLDYVATYWNQSTFDLWEEVSSSSFYTTAVQHRSLRQGAALATALGQTSSASTYSAQAANTLCFLQVRYPLHFLIHLVHELTVYRAVLLEPEPGLHNR